MFEDEDKFTVVNDEGEEVLCTLLFTFESDETGKNYVIYTDDTLDENGSTKVYASIYDPTGESTQLMPIETDQEWEIIENVLNELQDEIQGRIDQEEED